VALEPPLLCFLEGEKRAARLLWENLTPEQQNAWAGHRPLLVVTADTYTWGITKDNAFNVYLVDARPGSPILYGRNAYAYGTGQIPIRRGSALCAGISTVYPPSDNILAQKLALETLDGLQRFLDLANVYPDAGIMSDGAISGDPDMSRGTYA